MNNTELVLKVRRASWYNLKGNTFEEIPDQWYNLRTNRFVSNKPSTYDPVYGLKGIRVLGTKEDIDKFWELNNKQFTGRRMEDLLFEPFNDISFLANDAVHRSQICFTGTAGSVISTTDTTDVSLLTQEHMDMMCRFTFDGLFVKARIDNVIDGDTFDVVFYVPLVSLGRVSNQKSPIVLNSTQENIGFFTKVCVRMYGYDAAEKDTEAGKLAKKLMEEKLTLLDNTVWCQFINTGDSDKYGRSLVVLYEDEEKHHLLNTYLSDQEKIYNMKMVFPYLGGKKKTF